MQESQHNSKLTDYAIPCFRCGVCCIRFHVRVDFQEAQRIAQRLGCTWEAWVETYTERRWPGTDSFLLRRVNGVCVFLERLGEHTTNCAVHAFRPALCREWAASLLRRECQEGLAKYWGLTVSPSGQIEGPMEKVEAFYAFLKSLADCSG